MAEAGWDAGKDIFLFGIPLIAFLIFAFFRLDQAFTGRKKQSDEVPARTPSDKRHEKRMRSDPDGRPWDEE
jgi:hypothetical protein